VGCEAVACSSVLQLELQRRTPAYLLLDEVLLELDPPIIPPEVFFESVVVCVPVIGLEVVVSSLVVVEPVIGFLLVLSWCDVVQPTSIRPANAKLKTDVIV
jgi:hypothetical protein